MIGWSGRYKEVFKSMILKDPERHDKDEYLNGEEEEDEGWNEFYGLGDIKAEKELDFTSETK